MSEELKKENVDSVLMDLRNNGGGSLAEAIELTGLFIDKGPVVQERDSKGTISVESDSQSGPSWDGPLGVLINRASASASRTSSTRASRVIPSRQRRSRRRKGRRPRNETLGSNLPGGLGSATK